MVLVRYTNIANQMLTKAIWQKDQLQVYTLQGAAWMSLSIATDTHVTKEPPLEKHQPASPFELRVLS